MFSSQPNNRHGIILAIFSSFMMAFIAVSARFLSDYMHPFQIVMFGNFMALIWIAPIIIKHTKPRTLMRSHTPFLHCLRAVLEIAGWTCSYTAVTMLPLPIHTAMSFSTPLILSTVAVILLKEQHTYHTWVALFLGILGMLIIVRPEIGGSYNYGALFILFAACCFATCGVLIKTMATKGEPSGRITFFMLSLTAVLVIPMAILNWQPFTWEALPWIIALGLSTCAQQLSISQAFVKTKIVNIVPFIFVSLLPSSVIAYYVFDEVIDVWVVLGGFVIISSAVYAIKHTPR
ncbi:MAG: DMT family transporter [Rickettsiales bacterium]|nr:DMT family transporter [Rickettsiales bacterium]